MNLSQIKRLPVLALSTAIAFAMPQASADDDRGRSRGSEKLFHHIATFDVISGGNNSGVAEIVDTNFFGTQLVYTDADNGEIGFVNIINPYNPQADGTVEVGGEPTSLVVKGHRVLVAVNTSDDDFDNPTGNLVVVNRFNHSIEAIIPLGGQPDSLALAPNGRRAVLVLENERDEEENDGIIPQAPGGEMLIISKLNLPPALWGISTVDLSEVEAGAFAGSDLEPEYVDINKRNLAVVSFQENNHLAIVNVRTGKVVNHFSAGEVDLENVDTEEEDLINLNSDITKRREPDAVAWIDHDSFATANEGDYEDENGEEGGSRGFTIFNIDGTVEYESAESFEHWLVRVGHYNEGRSENKGIEPEAVEYGKYRGQELLFVGSERSNAVGVYDVKRGGAKPLQVLPTGIGPEGLKAISRRGLFVVSTENDEAGDGIPTMINIYKQGGSTYPSIESADDENGLPIPWVALSGLAGDPSDADTLYAVSDSFLDEGYVYTIDVSSKPATIVDRLQVTGIDTALDKVDLEGIAVGPDRSFWLGSEGNAGNRPNLVLKVDPNTGEAVSEIELPADLVDNMRNNGIEGIAVTGPSGFETVYVAIQRAWPNEGDIDEVNTKIGRYSVADDEWTFVHYPLEAETIGDWVGLSDLTVLPNGDFAIIERDKGWGHSTGPTADLKSVYKVDLESANFLPYVDGAANGGLDTIEKELLIDLLPALQEGTVWTTEKLEGFAVAADNQVYAVSDNDGVDGAPGETLFLHLGDLDDLNEDDDD